MSVIDDENVIWMGNVKNEGMKLQTRYFVNLPVQRQECNLGFQFEQTLNYLSAWQWIFENHVFYVNFSFLIQ